MPTFLLLLCAAAPEGTAPAEPAPPAAVPEPAPQRAILRIAVYELQANGVDPHVAQVVTDAVVLELRKLQRVSVIATAEVRAMLDHESQRQLAGCADESCLAEIGEALGVDGVVFGTLAAVGEERVFGLRRIDQRSARTLGQVSQRLVDAGGEEFLAAVGPAVAELFPELPLRDGEQRGVAPELALRLNPPPLPPWVFWATAGTTAAVSVATVFLLAVNVVTWQQNSALLAEATPEKPAPSALVRSQQETIDQTFWGTLAGTGVTLVGAGAAVVVGLFTDWGGDE